MAKKTTEVAVKPETPIAELPMMSAEEQASMYGDLGRESVNIPRLVVIEATSPELQQGLGMPGDLFIKSINRKLGQGPIEVVVLMRTMSRMSWKPITEGGGLLCQAQDGKQGVGLPGGECRLCPNKDWQGRNKPLCDQYENLIVVLRNELLSGDAFPFAISGSRTRLKGLKDFNTMLMMLVQKKRPLFAKSFEMRIVKKTNGQNTWHVFQFAPGNSNALLPNEETAAAYELFKSFSGKAINIEQDREDDAPAAAPAGAPSI